MFDLLFRNATIVDGTGRPRLEADLAVQDGKIAEIGKLPEDARAKRVIDGKGLFLTPGFVDVHSHADMVSYRDDHVDLMEALIRQGITTFVGGNCGLGLAPVPENNQEFNHTYWEGFTARKVHEEIDWKTMGEFLSTVERKGLALNMGVLAPHGILRIGAVGPDTRHATPDEVNKMGRWLDQAMEEGALGLSTGLQYFPGSQSHTTELIDLARIVSRRGGVFTSHLRSYSATLPQALEEVMLVGREAAVPVQVSHLFWVPDVSPLVNKLTRMALKAGSALSKIVDFPAPLDFEAAKLLAGINKRREAGEVRIGIDAMPTSAGFTHLLAFFPPYVFQARNKDEIIEKMNTKKMRKKIRRDIEKGDTKAWPHDKDNTWSMNFFKIMGWGTAFIMNVGSEKNRHLEGMNLVDIAKMWKMHPFDAACKLLIEEDGKVLVFNTVTHPGDDFIERSLYTTLADSHVSIVTDSVLMGFGRPSHLFYDCYPKFFQRYVRELGLVSWEDGIRKCSGLSADSLGIGDRGYLKRGLAADLVLFDPQAIGTNSTFENPDRKPDGIRLVAINGQVVLEGDRYSGSLKAGKVLRH